MSKEEHLSFLRANQPLSDDVCILNTDLDKLKAALQYFRENPDVNAIPLFLHVFGNGNGYGVYQLIEDVIMKFDASSVLPHLIAALNDGPTGVKYWNAQIAANFPRKELIIPLVTVLTSSKSSDTRIACITALEQINDDQVLKILIHQLTIEKDKEVRDLLCDIIREKKA